jgi:hypothetical protein
MVLCHKNLRNIGLKRHQVISLPGAPTCIGLVVASVLTILLLLAILCLYEHLAGIYYLEMKIVSAKSQQLGRNL